MEIQKLCSVVSCKNYEESKIDIPPPIMFEFPPRSDPSFEKWCSEIGRNDLLNKEAESQTNYVCMNHFEPTMYYYEDKFRLHDWAMPTLMKKEIVPSSLDNVTDQMAVISALQPPYVYPHNSIVNTQPLLAGNYVNDSGIGCCFCCDCYDSNCGCNDCLDGSDCLSSISCADCGGLGAVDCNCDCGACGDCNIC